MRGPEKREKQKEMPCLMGIMVDWQINKSEADV